MKRNRVDCKHPFPIFLSIFFILILSQFTIIKIVPDAEALRYSNKTNLSDVDGSFIGKEYDSLGFSLDIVGDVNGDGYDDIVISGIGNGKVYLIFGNDKIWTMDVNISEGDASFIEEYSGDNFGSSVAGPGDVNGDGFDDILIGANGRGNLKGEVYFILGRKNGWGLNTPIQQIATASFIGESNRDGAGYRLNKIGDINGDGFNDILISAHHNSDERQDAGKVYLFFGKSKRWNMRTSLIEADASFKGEEFSRAGEYFGGGGDLNGDGYDDIIVSASDDHQNYIIFGGTGNWNQNVNLSEYSSQSIKVEALTATIAGDVNNDGFDDIITGSLWYPGGKGQIYLFLGKRDGWTLDMGPEKADASFIGERINDRTGAAISSAGDVNGDGLNKLGEEPDPLIADTDGDRVLDGYEYRLLDAEIGDGFNDSDLDGRINILEFDSDNDGLSDGEENWNASTPTEAARIDAKEMYPFDADSDDDALLDGAEAAAFVDTDNDGDINARDANSNNDSSGDYDQTFVIFRTNATDINADGRLDYVQDTKIAVCGTSHFEVGVLSIIR